MNVANYHADWRTEISRVCKLLSDVKTSFRLQILFQYHLPLYRQNFSKAVFLAFDSNWDLSLQWPKKYYHKLVYVLYVLAPLCLEAPSGHSWLSERTRLKTVVCNEHLFLFIFIQQKHFACWKMLNANILCCQFHQEGVTHSKLPKKLLRNQPITFWFVRGGDQVSGKEITLGLLEDWTVKP